MCWHFIETFNKMMRIDVIVTFRTIKWKERVPFYFQRQEEIANSQITPAMYGKNIENIRLNWFAKFLSENFLQKALRYGRLVTFCFIRPVLEAQESHATLIDLTSKCPSTCILCSANNATSKQYIAKKFNRNFDRNSFGNTKWVMTRLLG